MYLLTKWTQRLLIALKKLLIQCFDLSLTLAVIIFGTYFTVKFCLSLTDYNLRTSLSSTTTHLGKSVMALPLTQTSLPPLVMGTIQAPSQDQASDFLAAYLFQEIDSTDSRFLGKKI